MFLSKLTNINKKKKKRFLSNSKCKANGTDIYSICLEVCLFSCLMTYSFLYILHINSTKITNTSKTQKKEYYVKNQTKNPLKYTKTKVN